MKQIFKLSIIVLLNFSIISCNGQNKENSPNVIKQEKMQELTLIISAGGVRAHIINVTQNNELVYKIGSIIATDSLNLSDVKWNDDYKEVRKKLNNENIKIIQNYCTKKEVLMFNDNRLVKDSWEYYLYINNKKIAFGRKFNYDVFPSELKELLNYLLYLTGKLYIIPEMS